jgi:hypothetical protein
MEQLIFAFSLTIEGTTEKGLLFLMPLKSICNKNLSFIIQKCIFEHNREVQTIKNVFIDIILVKISSKDFFRAAPFRLTLVFKKDALFYLTIKFFFKNLYRICPSPFVPQKCCR